jgi:hypothetical protein
MFLRNVGWLSESESRYDRRSVGQYVLVSSPIWGSWLDINYSVTVLSMSSAPSDDRLGLSFVLVTWTASVQFSKFAAGPRQLLILIRRRATVITDDFQRTTRRHIPEDRSRNHRYWSITSLHTNWRDMDVYMKTFEYCCEVRTELSFIYEGQKKKVTKSSAASDLDDILMQ